MSRTTIKLSGGSFGGEYLLVRCDLAQASSPIETSSDGKEWSGTQYQCADARHTRGGLTSIGRKLAAEQCEVSMDATYIVKDQGSSDANLSFDEAVERIADWYESVDEWSDGKGDAAMRDAVANAISVVEQPTNGDIDDLRSFVEEIRAAVAGVLGGKEFHGHGNYSVSAADGVGLGLAVEEQPGFDCEVEEVHEYYISTDSGSWIESEYCSDVAEALSMDSDVPSGVTSADQFEAWLENRDGYGFIEEDGARIAEVNC